MNPVNFNTLRELDVVCVDGAPYLFTNLRVDRNTMPEGMVAYDVRDGDGDGNFHQVATYVMVNHWGTIIGFDRIEDAEKDKGYCCRPCDGNYMQSCLNADTFRTGYNELLEESRKYKESYEEDRKRLAELPMDELLQEFFALAELDDEDEVTASFVYDLVENTAEAEEVRARYYANASPDTDLYYAYINAMEDYFQFLDDEQNDELEEGETREEYIDAIKEAEKDLREHMTATEKGEQNEADSML